MCTKVPSQNRSSVLRKSYKWELTEHLKKSPRFSRFSRVTRACLSASSSFCTNFNKKEFSYFREPQREKHFIKRSSLWALVGTKFDICNLLFGKYGMSPSGISLFCRPRARRPRAYKKILSRAVLLFPSHPLHVITLNFFPIKVAWLLKRKLPCRQINLSRLSTSECFAAGL